MVSKIEYDVLKLDGEPTHAVVEYSVFMDLLETINAEPTARDLVRERVKGADNLSPVKAWREQLGLAQAVVAERLGISQPAYLQQENQDFSKLRHSTKCRLAAAFGIELDELIVN